MSTETTLTLDQKVRSLRTQINRTGGRLFSVEFVKRTDGTYRKMVCFRRGPDGRIPTGMSFDPWAKNLCPVYDISKRENRMIALDTVCRFKFKDIIIRFDNPETLMVDGTVPKEDIHTQIRENRGGVRVQIEGNKKVDTKLSVESVRFTDLNLIMRRLRHIEGIDSTTIRPSTLCALFEDLGIMPTSDTET